MCILQHLSVLTSHISKDQQTHMDISTALDSCWNEGSISRVSALKEATEKESDKTDDCKSDDCSVCEKYNHREDM